MQLIQDLEQDKSDTLPDKYTFNHLPVALVTHQGALRVPAESTAMLNVTHSRPLGQESDAIQDGEPLSPRPHTPRTQN